MIGQNIAHYRITAKLGEGGMDAGLRLGFRCSRSHPTVSGSLKRGNMSTDRKLMSVDVTLQPTFKAGFPKVLFQTAVWATLTPASWDMTPNGERFLVITSPENDAASIAVEMNWQKALRK